jgi:hypothetical protein
LAAGNEAGWSRRTKLTDINGALFMGRGTKFLHIVNKLLRSVYSYIYVFRIARAEYSRGRLSEARGGWDSGNLEGRGGLGEGWGK